MCPSLEKCCLLKTSSPPKTKIRKRSFIEFEKQFNYDFVPPNSKMRTCGHRTEHGIRELSVPFVNKTLYAQYAEFPWMMAIFVESQQNGKKLVSFKNGGSLIHPRFVLTSAHGVAYDPTKIIVRAGEWDLTSEIEYVKSEERKVQKVIRHEEFSRENLQNDIALLILKQEFVLSSFINTICLPPKNMNFDGMRCFSSGWGKNKFGKQGVYQAFLKKVELPIVSTDSCQQKLRRTRLGEYFELHEGFLCAGKNS